MPPTPPKKAARCGTNPFRRYLSDGLHCQFRTAAPCAKKNSFSNDAQLGVGDSIMHPVAQLPLKIAPHAEFVVSPALGARGRSDCAIGVSEAAATHGVVLIGQRKVHYFDRTPGQAERVIFVVLGR